MIYNSMTEEQWNDWKSRVDAFLLTDIKEYGHGVSLLMEALSDRTIIRQFQWGDPARYISKLKSVLSRVRELSKYPRLISKECPLRPPYLASVPYHPEEQIPGAAVPEPIIPLDKHPYWNRYMKFDTYKDRLPVALRTEGEEIDCWFANQRRLHELAKNQQRTGVKKEIIAQTLEDLTAQEARIKDYFDRVEDFMTQKDASDKDSPAAPDTNGQPADEKPSGSFSKAEIEAMENPVFAALCKEKRKEANIKYITRKDLKQKKNPDELALRIRELEEWGYDVPLQESEEPEDAEAEKAGEEKTERNEENKAENE